MEEMKRQIIEAQKEMLLSVERKGMKELVEYMEEKGFFTSPASSKYHGNYEGGLAEHCDNVYVLFSNMLHSFDIFVSESTRIICGFGHDLCKMGAYKSINENKNDYVNSLLNKKEYMWNQDHPKGHAKLSLAILKKFIELKPIEEEIILYHMGMYGTKEFSASNGEYSIHDLSDVFNRNKLAKLFYFCDDMSSQFLEEKKDV